LLPGETRRYEQKVELVRGHPTEQTPVAFSFRDRTGKEFLTKHARLPVQGQALPRLVWQVTPSDAQPGGDGDGNLEAGERLSLGLTVTNAGTGSTQETFARIKNKSGRALDITRGTVEPGFMVAADGSRCGVLEAGVEAGTVVGDRTAGSARIDKGDAPKYAEGCKRRLAPGETWSGSFEVLVKPSSEHDLGLELSIGDAGAYDHAAIVRSGFYSYFTNEQEISLPLGKRLPELPKSVPPEVQITRAPGLVVSGERAGLSGVVTDETGIAHVEVYHGEDKVFFQGSVRGAHVRSVPFTADVELTPGLNTFSVLATDEQGFTDTSSVVTFYEAPEQQANAVDVLPMGSSTELRRQ
jgi:carboxyl-terminal processing protease